MIRAILFLLLPLLSPPALAQSWQDIGGLKMQALAFARQQTTALPGEVTVSVGSLEDSLRLPVCPAPEAWLPAGNRLWGSTTVGIRCKNPLWNVFVPIQVKVMGMVAIAARPLPQGHALTEQDVILQKMDLTDLAATVITDPALTLGKTLTTSIGAGLVLRSDMLKAAVVIKQGQTVKLVAKGQGFSVTSEAKALANGAEGQIIPVKTPSGQTVKGVAKVGGIVEVTF